MISAFQSQSYDRILGGWGDTGAGPPSDQRGFSGRPSKRSGVPAGRAETSSGLAAREVSEAAERRRSVFLSDAAEGGVPPEARGRAVSIPASSLGEDRYGSLDGVFRVYPHELDCDVVEEVIASLGLGERCALTSVLEEASAVLAVKSRVKGATWLRHAARARGMPIYALKAEGIPQLARAIQAMLGLNALNAGAGESVGATGSFGESFSEGSSLNGRAGLNGSPDASNESKLAAAAVAAAFVSATATAEETDALEEVRMAVEQLVIPHQEAVELLPRDSRLMRMQTALIAEEYRLQYEECGEGAARRIRILHTYADSA